MINEDKDLYIIKVNSHPFYTKKHNNRYFKIGRYIVSCDFKLKVIDKDISKNKITIELTSIDADPIEGYIYFSKDFVYLLNYNGTYVCKSDNTQKCLIDDKEYFTASSYYLGLKPKRIINKSVQIKLSIDMFNEIIKQND